MSEQFFDCPVCRARHTQIPFDGDSLLSVYDQLRKLSIPDLELIRSELYRIANPILRNTYLHQINYTLLKKTEGKW